MKKKIYLQLFSEGGATAGASTSGDGGAATTGVDGASPVAQGEDVSQIIYGTSNQSVADSIGSNSTDATDIPFDDLIKKGGKYAEDFEKKTQAIIDKRFKKAKATEEKLNSLNPILDTLAMKYGIDANDIAGIAKAIDEDESLFEEAAFKEGLTTKQYREKVALEREVASLRAAEEEAAALQHSKDIYSGWLKDGEELSRKYGIQNFDLARECDNEQFTSLLSAGVPLEEAYKVIHFDDMLGGAMAQTASNVESAVTQRVAARASRPSENGITPSAGTSIFKPDPSTFNDQDIDECIRRARAGERISFG